MLHSIFQIDEKRRTKWDKMWVQISIDLSEKAYNVFEIVEKYSDEFEKIFSNFARSNVVLTHSEPKSLIQRLYAN